jgi:hypothetical protein
MFGKACWRGGSHCTDLERCDQKRRTENNSGTQTCYHIFSELPFDFSIAALAEPTLQTLKTFAYFCWR